MKTGKKTRFSGDRDALHRGLPDVPGAGHERPREQPGPRRVEGEDAVALRALPAERGPAFFENALS